MGMKPFSGSAGIRSNTQGKAQGRASDRNQGKAQDKFRDSAFPPQGPKGRDTANRYRPDSSAGKKIFRDFFGLPKHLHVFPVLRYAVGIAAGLLIFAGLGAALTHGYNLFMAGGYFALKNIEISGNMRLSAREISNTLELSKGENTLNVSLDAMEAALKNNRWIAEFAIKRELPDTFKILIRERKPEYLVNRGGVLYYADLRGIPIMPIMPALVNDFVSLPALEIETGAEGYAARLPELVNSIKKADVPLDSANLDWLRLSAGGLLELKANSYLRVVVSLDEWEKNLQHLKQVLADLSRRGELRNTAEIRAQGSNVWVLKKADI